jgi:sensor histidine kinase regulating citrate/malate metabolism
MMEMQKQNAEIMEQSVAVVNQKYHDLKYQIQLLKDGISDGDSLKYLDQISEDIKNYEARNKTGNAALDTILTTKSLYCQANWIELTCVCDGHAIDFIDQVDIATLFGNLLDNAIEAVSKMEHKEKRLIHLTVSREKNFVKIRLENCTDDIPVMKNGLPQTTKKDKRYHGYGVKSIQSITRKYGGSVTFSVNDGWFESRVLMSVR